MSCHLLNKIRFGIDAVPSGKVRYYMTPVTSGENLIACDALRITSCQRKKILKFFFFGKILEILNLAISIAVVPIFQDLK